MSWYERPSLICCCRCCVSAVVAVVVVVATAASLASKGPLITGALASATVEGGPEAPPRLHKAKHYPTEDVIIAILLLMQL